MRRIFKRLIEEIEFSDWRPFFAWILFLVFSFFIENYLLKAFFMVAFTVIIAYSTYSTYRRNKYIKKMENFCKQITYINSLTEALRGSMKLEEVLTLILKNLIDGLNFDRALIYIVQQEHRPVVHYSAGYDKGGKFDYSYNVSLDKENSILARSIIEQQTYIITDAPNNFYCEQALVEKLNLKEFGLIPIVIKGRSVGVIFVDNYISKKKIDDDTIQALKVFANQSGIAIENAKIHETIESLATRDGLTNIYNHRYFQEALRKELEKSAKYNRPLSLIFIDIDNFKDYNDKNGHVEGDDLLKEITQLFRENIRDVDILARYGGEEFVIVLPETSRADAYQIAEKARKAVEGYTFKLAESQSQGRITVSMGVSAFPEDASSPETLIDIADKGLYKAKTIGKNRVCSYSQQ
ncbi:MAG: sensor domain-containing diguanylate cyclase [Elusimicrobia bacterium]|nr:sensor domain-containing diguanylate cyclase [Elusimicrobiota bacterium]MBU2614331.1 sensor domain-containing diguanylate cyclase [Elusimicrobiota bacterium]